MARVKNITYDEAGPELRKIYDEVMRTFGIDRVPNFFCFLGTNPVQMKGYLSKIKQTLFEGEIPRLLKELLIFAISRTNGSYYCTVAHAHFALQMDKTLSYMDLVAISDGQGPDLPESWRLVIQIGKKIGTNPLSISKDDIDQLRDAGYNEAQIAELISIIDLAAMVNMYTIITDIPVDESYLETEKAVRDDPYASERSGIASEYIG